MPRPKKPKPPKPPPINKIKLIERLVEKPSQGIKLWLIRECSILKNLAEKFPLPFLNQLKFSNKLPSLAVLFSDYYINDLTNRFRAYMYVPPVHEQIILGEKVGEDLEFKKKPNLRELLK